MCAVRTHWIANPAYCYLKRPAVFRRNDKLVVTQSEHSRLSGEIALMLGRLFEQDIHRLAGAIAVHDWPHFGGSQADTIEIGKKTAAQQRELVERLSADLPVDPYTELVMRMHWKRLTDEADVELRTAVNQGRIDDLMEQLGFDIGTAGRLDHWTDVCDGLAFYLSQGSESAGKDVLLDLAGERSWSFHWSVRADYLSIHQVRVGRPDALVHRDEALDLVAFDTDMSLLAYQADGYPQKLSPVMKVICCKFGA